MYNLFALHIKLQYKLIKPMNKNFIHGAGPYFGQQDIKDACGTVYCSTGIFVYGTILSPKELSLCIAIELSNPNF